MTNSQPPGGLGGPLAAQKAHQELVARIEKAAKTAFDQLPDIPDSKLTVKGKEHVKETRRLIRADRVASELPKDKLEELSKRLKGFSDRTKLLLADNKQNDGGVDENPRCTKVYDDCMDENGCVDDGLVCLCCAPCSVLYLRCVFGDIFAGKSGNGLFLAPKDQDAAKT